MTGMTAGIRLDLPPDQWRQHRFGLSPERWQALAGGVYWVTGAGTGYGQALAIALAAAGGRVAVTGRRQAKLAETVAMAGAFAPGAELAAFPGDITDPQAMVNIAAAIAGRWGGPTALVAAAALPQAGKGGLTEITPQTLCGLVETNVLGQLFCARAALPAMRAARCCRMVFLTSEAGWAFTPGFGPYAMTKAALNSLAGSLAEEIAAADPGADVQINVLSPGEARTEMNQGSTISPFILAPMALSLLSHPPPGPNGCYFHRDGQHWPFAGRPAWPHPL